MKDLGLISNIEVIQQFVSIEGKSVVDIGCGDMTVSRLLAENGAFVLAIDPDPVQAEKNRVAGPISSVRFEECGADSIPATDDSVDGVFFSYSLHHIPAELYEQVFAEVIRVLKPDGFLYVIEPTDCPLNQVMMLFHNEESERAEAQGALSEIAKPRFQTAEEAVYHSMRQFDDFDDFANHYSSRSFNSLYSEDDVRSEKVRELFEHHGTPEYSFVAPKRVMVLKNLLD